MAAGYETLLDTPPLTIPNLFEPSKLGGTGATIVVAPPSRDLAAPPAATVVTVRARMGVPRPRIRTPSPNMLGGGGSVPGSPSRQTLSRSHR